MASSCPSEGGGRRAHERSKRCKTYQTLSDGEGMWHLMVAAPFGAVARGPWQ